MLVSVIIPVYNVEKYIDKCLESIVCQTYKYLDIILVDDGSTDQSPKICDDWAARDERIRVIHKSNRGLSSARNAGMDIALGELFSFIDSDDFIELDMYETMVDEIIKSGKDIACCGRIVDIWGIREKTEFTMDTRKEFTCIDAIKEVLLLRNIDVSACDKVYKKKLFEEIRYPEGKISEDAAVIFQLLNKSNGIIHVGKPFYHYIFRKNSISKSTYSHKKYDSFENCLNTLEFVKSNHRNLMIYANIYNTQICGNLIESMYDGTDALKKYYEDYRDYKTIFNKGFWPLLVKEGISVKIKIRLFFIYIGKYEWFEALKNIPKCLIR